MESELFSEEVMSVTTPLVHNVLASNSQNTRTTVLTRWLRRYVYIWAAAFIAGVCGLLFGYEVAIIGGALLQLKSEFCLGVLQSEVVASSSAAGAFFGSLSGGIPVDFLGRRVSIQIDVFIYIIGALMLAVSLDYWMLVLGRLIVGYGISLSVTSACIYFCEIAPAKYRGMLIEINQFGVSFGVVLAYVVGNIFIDVPEGWRYMFGLSIIIAVIQGIGTLFLPRTPRFLLLKGKDALALSTLQKIRGRDTDVGSEFNEMRAAILEESQYHWWDLFRLKDNMLLRMFIGSTITLFQQLSGQSSILFYAPTLLKTLGFTSNSAATLASICMGVTKFISSIIAFFTIDKLGRRPLLLIGTSLLAISMLLLGGLSVAFIDSHLVMTTGNNSIADLSKCNHTTQSEYTFPINATFSSSEQTSITATKWASLILFMLYIAAYQISYGAVSWLLLTEIFPSSVRGQAFSLASMVNWVMNFIVSSTLLSLYHTLLGYTYIIYGMSSVLALVFIFFMVPETKRKSLEKISQDFRKKKLCSQ